MNHPAPGHPHPAGPDPAGTHPDPDRTGPEPARTGHTGGEHTRAGPPGGEPASPAPGGEPASGEPASARFAGQAPGGEPAGGGVLAVLGEAVVDLVEQGDGLYRAHPGGSPLNVAVGLARLGRPTVLHARISTDAFGRMFRRHLAASGVDERGLVSATEPSTLAIASLDPAGVASYGFWVQGTADWQWTAAELAAPLRPDVLALHTGSMALEVEPGAGLVLQLLRRERARDRVTLSYDPNVRLARQGAAEAGRARVAHVVRLAHIVKVSADDLAWIRPGADPVAVAREWAATGPALVVVTLGGRGAVAVTAGGAQVHRAARPVTVVDTVGAGDAFTAGLLDGLAGGAAGCRPGARLLGPGAAAGLAALTSAELAGLLDHAALVAALTCGRAGADPPTRADLAAAANSD